MYVSTAMVAILATIAPRVIVNGTNRPIIVSPGEVVEVSVQGAPGNAADWIAKSKKEDPYRRHFPDWKYLNGTQAPGGSARSGLYLFRMPMEPGAYNFRLFQNDRYALIGFSAPVTVRVPPVAYSDLPCEQPSPLAPDQRNKAAALDADRGAAVGVGLIATRSPSTYPRPAESTNDLLRRGSCAATAVITGRVQSHTVLLSPGRIAWTEYSILVDGVHRQAPERPIASGSLLTVTRSGGHVCVGDSSVAADDPWQAPLANGERYLLFLHWDDVAKRYATSEYDWRLDDSGTAARAHARALGNIDDVDATALLAALPSVSTCE